MWACHGRNNGERAGEIMKYKSKNKYTLYKYIVLLKYGPDLPVVAET